MEAIVTGLTVFVVLGTVFVLINLTLGRLIRPTIPHPEKGEIYECGEPTIGGAHVQFDLRFYVVALVFVVFDVEIGLLWPWARVFVEHSLVAFWDLSFFFGVLMVGYVFLWRFGYLDWVRSAAHHQAVADEPSRLSAEPPQQRSAGVAAGSARTPADAERASN